MLPRAQRLTSTLDYSRVVRHGARVSTPRIVMHIAAAPAESGGQDVVVTSARFGFVVSKLIGSAPRRNRVRRQLRELARAHASSFTGDVVIRALPAAADATWADLSEDFLRCATRSSDARR